MLAWTLVRHLGMAAATAGLLVGCVVQDGTGVSGSGGTSGSSSGGTTTPPTQPMLVDVDPNQTMNASPGGGVGVFVQYKTGGHWEIWWTCDTNVTGLSCQFQNTVSVASGTITNIAEQAFEPADVLTQLTPQSIQATTNTTIGVDVITFDTPFSPGQVPVITLRATLDGMANGAFLFFVQDGQINGNYQGQLTDPLQLEPKTP